jgi:YfiH family protein
MRVGGVSPFPEKSLHLSFKNDSIENVRENRKRFLSTIKAPHFTIVTPEQTHSSQVTTVDEMTLETIKHKEQYEPHGDALLSDRANVFMGIKTADCLPLLIADPETGAMAAVHAGWKGTLDRITEKAVSTLENLFGAKPENCLAAMGPSACGGCYEVGPDVSDPFRKAFPYSDDLFAPSPNEGKMFLDVKLANAMQLLSSGLSPMKIFGADECTMHENELFFSHRLESKMSGEKVGRLLSIIGRNPT